MTTLTAYRPSLLGRGVFDDIFDSMLDFPQLMQRTTQGYPVADIYREDNGDTVMEFALAGFRKEELSIAIKPEKKSVTVSASTDDITAEERKRRVARRNFSKTYINYDSNLDLNATTAEFENGLLRLVIPTRESEKPLSIDIR
jgi:HSP20 family molecular chaperone IbpA